MRQQFKKAAATKTRKCPTVRDSLIGWTVQMNEYCSRRGNGAPEGGTERDRLIVGGCAADVGRQRLQRRPFNRRRKIGGALPATLCIPCFEPPRVFPAPDCLLSVLNKPPLGLGVVVLRA